MVQNGPWYEWVPSQLDGIISRLFSKRPPTLCTGPQTSGSWSSGSGLPRQPALGARGRTFWRYVVRGKPCSLGGHLRNKSPVARWWETGKRYYHRPSVPTAVCNQDKGRVPEFICALFPGSSLRNGECRGLLGQAQAMDRDARGKGLRVFYLAVPWPLNLRKEFHFPYVVAPIYLGQHRNAHHIYFHVIFSHVCRD